MSDAPVLASDLIVPPSLPLHTFSLANGLTTHIQPDRRSPMACIHLRYHVGTSQEPEGHSGLSHVLEHMLFEGSSKVAAGEYARIIHSLGGHCNGSTQDDVTVYSLHIPAMHLEMALELLADSMVNARLDTAAFTRAKAAVRAERRLNVDNSQIAKAIDSHTALAYGDSPFGQPSYGRLADLDDMTIEATRVWYRSHYAPNNATLIVVGDVDPAQVERWVEQYFAGWPAVALRAIAPPRYRTQWGKRRQVLRLPGVRACLLMSFNVPTVLTADSPRTVYALMVINTLLAGGNFSLLHDRLVRSEQILTSVHPHYEHTLRGDATLNFTGYLAPGVTPAAAERALLDVVDSLKRSLPDEAVLEAVKLRLLAAHAEQRASLERQADMIGTAVSAGTGPACIEAHQRLLADVTRDDVRNALATYLVSERLTVTHVHALQPERVVMADMTCADLGPSPTPVDFSALQAVKRTVAAAAVRTGRSIERWMTSQGAPVRFVASPGTGLVNLQLRFRAGAHHDADTPGLAALTLYMLNQGCDGMDAAQFAQALESLGASYGREVSHDHAILSLSCPARPALCKAAFDLFGACCARPSFEPHALLGLRTRLLNYLSHREADVTNRLDAELLRRLYEAPAFSGDYRGERTSVALLERQQLHDFHQRAYTAGNVEIALVADLTRAQAERVLDDLCAGLPVAPAPLPAVPIAVARRTPKALRIQTPSQDSATDNVLIELSYAVDLRPHDRDYPALLVANQILGGGPHSRLFAKLRDRRSLTYNARSRLNVTSSAAQLTVSWDVRPQYLDASVALVRLIVGCLIEHGPNTVEREMAHQQLLGSHLDQFGDDRGLTSLLTRMGSPGWPDEDAAAYSARLAQVSAEDIQRVARSTFDPDRCALTCIGPAAKQEPLPAINAADR